MTETPTEVPTPAVASPTTKKERRAARKKAETEKFLKDIEPIRKQARLTAFTGGKLTPFVRQFLTKEELELVLEARRIERQKPTVRKLRRFLGIESGRQWRMFRKAQQRAGLPVEMYVAKAIENIAAARAAAEKEAEHENATSSAAASEVIGPDLTNGDIVQAAQEAAKTTEKSE